MSPDNCPAPILDQAVLVDIYDVATCHCIRCGFKTREEAVTWAKENGWEIEDMAGFKTFILVSKK